MMMKEKSFAEIIYRLPGKSTCVRLSSASAPVPLMSCEELGRRHGFVFAPFKPSSSHPVWLVVPDKTEVFPQDSLALSVNNFPLVPTCSDEREVYAVDFANFHAHILSGEYDKMVLARCSHMRVEGVAEDTCSLARQLFARACRLYPRLFVALVSMPQTGTWLMATPEILLDGQGGQLRTIALAGTMPLDERLLDLPVEKVWTEKNLMEQEYVSTYIAKQVERFSSDFNASGPYTTKSAGLMHLRTDFNFSLSSGETLGSVLSALHPTPAVCGMPKEGVEKFIMDNESFHRQYYSGFLGMLSPEQDTHLYVSLRCMRLLDKGMVNFYAGGGLLADSVEEDEWRETEAKMQTMKALFEAPIGILRSAATGQTRNNQ